jgi:capsular polysaccharide biosynthesis protein
MLKYGSLSDTEVMYVTVTTTDPYEAAEIANCIAEVLPQRISKIIKGATMIVVDSAVPVLQKVAPSISQYTVVGFILGFVLCCAVIVVLDILDDTIHSEEHVLTTYDYPILARIPDVLNSGSQKYGYYYKKYGYYNKRYGYEDSKNADKD